MQNCKVRRGYGILDEMKARKMVLDIKNNANLIIGYCLHGRMFDGLSLFEEMTKKDYLYHTCLGGTL